MINTRPLAFLVVVALAVASLAADDAKEFRNELRKAQAKQSAKQYKDCVKVCDELLARYKDPAQVREVTMLKAEALVQDGEVEAALKVLATLAEANADDRKLQAAVALRSGDLWRSLKKPDEALAAYRKAAASAEEPDEAAAALLRAADVLLELKRPAEARAEMTRVLCSCPLRPDVCQQAQARIVESHRAESKWPEALGAARILYDAAGDEQAIRAAAQAVAQAFLACDGTLARANEFLAFQSYGPAGPDGKPGTPDDVAANHLAKLKYPAFDAAAGKQFQAAIDAQPKSYEGYRAKGFLCVYWGKPKEAASQFLLAFKAASLSQVAAAAQELVLVGIKAHTASFRGLDRVFDYINHGPKGKSGKETIPDPFAGL
ncbi:MAG TPA: tetratricopeptide repeat protein [Planctomycetota bacterium]|nr:tetratricopeptide repeat protein [Planctomycetota bacterium]